MKYKVGDKVTIKPYEYLIHNDLTDCEGEMAEQWGGQTMTIKKIMNGFGPCHIILWKKIVPYGVGLKS